MKTHYRKAFNSPYLSSADIVEPTTLTIAKVALEKNRAGKTSVSHNTAHFEEKEIRPGEKLKPMILNVTNCKFMTEMCGSSFIDDWRGVVTVFVEHGVPGVTGELGDGLRLRGAPAYISTDQATEINDLIEEVGADKKAFFKWLGAESAEKIPANKYEQAKAGLEAKRG